jgi:hypothetical protein
MVSGSSDMLADVLSGTEWRYEQDNPASTTTLKEGSLYKSHRKM